MSTPLRFAKDIRATALRRILSNSKGLGYWAAIDWARKHAPELLPRQFLPEEVALATPKPGPSKPKPPRRKNGANKPQHFHQIVVQTLQELHPEDM